MSQYIDVRTQDYPLSLDDILLKLGRVSIPENASDFQLLRYGYARVYPAPRPEGFVVKESTPRLIDGRFVQSWSIIERVDINLLKRQLETLLDKRYQCVLERGYPYDNAFVDLEDDTLLLGVITSIGDIDSTCELTTVDGDMIRLPSREAVCLLGDIVRYRKTLRRTYRTFKERIRTIIDEENHDEVKEALLSSEVLSC